MGGIKKIQIILDCRELLELVVIFLGIEISSNFKFRLPGPSHHARWMAKAIYSLKIFMFRDQFRIKEEEIRGIRDVCIFLVVLYVKAWFTSSLSIEAPDNDIQFIKNAIAYSKIDSTISNIILKKISNHLWYLATETVAFSFFDNKVPISQKRKMVSALKKQEEPVKRFIATSLEIEKTFISKNVCDFVSSDTKNFFKRFGISTEFLHMDPSAWPRMDSYNDAVNICRHIKVVNDTAERFVQLFSSYNLSLTKDESQKQYLLQVVDEYKKKFPSHNKNQLL